MFSGTVAVNDYLALKIYCIYALILYLFFSILITKEIASALNIRVFRVKEIRIENNDVEKQTVDVLIEK